MEQRNEALKESGEQTRKRLMELLEEKAKLERELNEASLTLSENNRQYSNLNRQYIAAKSELGTCHVSIAKPYFSPFLGRNRKTKIRTRRIEKCKNCS
jgi:hypothetical protein